MLKNRGYDRNGPPRRWPKVWGGSVSFAKLFLPRPTRSAGAAYCAAPVQIPDGRPSLAAASALYGTIRRARESRGRAGARREKSRIIDSANRWFRQRHSRHRHFGDAGRRRRARTPQNPWPLERSPDMRRRQPAAEHLLRLPPPRRRARHGPMPHRDRADGVTSSAERDPATGLLGK